MSKLHIGDGVPEHLPPNSVEAEQVLLGSVLVNPSPMPELADMLVPTDFYLLRHNLIWKSCLALYANNITVDNLTVADHLRQTGQLTELGGSFYLNELINISLDFPDNWLAFAHLVEAASIRRQLMVIAKHIADIAQNANKTVKDITDECESGLLEVTRKVNHTDGAGEISAPTAVRAALSKMIGYALDQRSVRGYATGIGKLDQILHGIMPGDLLGVIGRSGSGKTTLMCQFIQGLATAGVKMVIFPTEQTVEQYTMNLTSHFLGVTLEELIEGRVSFDDLTRAENAMRKWPMTFYDRTGPSPQQVTTFVREKSRVGLCDIAIIDGMNDMYVKGPIYDKTVECMTALHSIMRDGIPVVFSVQANRGPADRRNKRPLMSDAQGGGIIEQKVTRFLSIYRPGFDVEIGEVSAESSNFDPRYVEIQVLKDRFFNRQGTIIKGMWIAGRGFIETDNHRIAPSIHLPGGDQ